MCHSDLHSARNEWAVDADLYPCVPGHGIIGRVSRSVQRCDEVQGGRRWASGVWSIRAATCPNCRDGLDNYCPDFTLTYSSPDKHGPRQDLWRIFRQIVVDEHFVLRISENLDPAAAAPLLCAGITTYSPLAALEGDQGKKVGIVGLGGLGHMGVKFAHALGT